MAAMRNTPARRPTVIFQHPERTKIFDQAIAESAVELEPVSIRTHSPVANQVSSILHRGQILAGSHRARIPLAQFVLELVIERITRLFEPEKRVFCKGVSIGQRSFPVEPAVEIGRAS